MLDTTVWSPPGHQAMSHRRAIVISPSHYPSEVQTVAPSISLSGLILSLFKYLFIELVSTHAWFVFDELEAFNQQIQQKLEDSVQKNFQDAPYQKKKTSKMPNVLHAISIMSISI